MCHEQSADAVTVAYEAGFHQALVLAAERVDELEATWCDIQRPTYEEKVAARIAEFELQAMLNHWHWGTQPFAGLDNGAELPGAEW